MSGIGRLFGHGGGGKKADRVNQLRDRQKFKEWRRDERRHHRQVKREEKRPKLRAGEGRGLSD